MSNAKRTVNLTGLTSFRGQDIVFVPVVQDLARRTRKLTSTSSHRGMPFVLLQVASDISDNILKPPLRSP